MLGFLLASVFVSAAAAAWDWRTGRIPNWLTLGSAVAGIVGHGAHGWVVAGWRVGLYESAAATGGLLFCCLAPAAMYFTGAMGGGDLKLFAAIGALCQPMLGIEVQMYSLVVAAIAAPARLAYQGRLLHVLGGTLALLLNPFRSRDKRRTVPTEAKTWFRLGPSVFAGAVITLVLHTTALWAS